MSFESFQQQVPQEDRERESLYDPRLEILWDEYGFPGTPPKEGSIAEKRLKDKCSLYSVYLEDHKGESLDVKKSSDSQRRQLHNEIAVMVVGQKRSGMDSSDAEHIANFAYEYARGLPFDQAGSFKEN